MLGEPGSTETVKLLLDHGAHINAQGGLYGSSLQAASHRLDGEMVQFLLNHGADINAMEVFAAVRYTLPVATSMIPE